MYRRLQYCVVALALLGAVLFEQLPLQAQLLPFPIGGWLADQCPPDQTPPKVRFHNSAGNLAAEYAVANLDQLTLEDGVDAAWRWTFLPQGFLYRTYWASAAEPRLSTQLLNRSGENQYLDSYIAGRVGLFRFGRPDKAEGFQLDLLAGAKLRQDTEFGLDVIGTDYRFDIPLTYRQGQHAWKFGYYHTSAHAGDEFLLRHPGYPRLNWVRDALYLGYSFDVTPELRVYAEADYAFYQQIAGPWNFQFGIDYGPTRPTGIRGAPFFAINGHLREELDFGGNLNLQFGWAWRGEGPTAGILRTGLFYYNGGSPQFSFYHQNEQQFGWGLWYDF